MNTIIIAVGSNMEPEENVRLAREAIAGSMELVAESSLIRTKPIGFTDQPDFLNCAFLVRTGMDYEEAKGWLKRVEKRLGRVRTRNRNGPRTIDLDIVVWNNRVIDDDVYLRDFLKDAVQELLPELRL